MCACVYWKKLFIKDITAVISTESNGCGVPALVYITCVHCFPPNRRRQSSIFILGDPLFLFLIIRASITVFNVGVPIWVSPTLEKKLCSTNLPCNLFVCNLFPSESSADGCLLLLARAQCSFLKESLRQFDNCSELFYWQVDVLAWASNKHNMGMAFDRKTWNDIKACSDVSFFYSS